MIRLPASGAGSDTIPLSYRLRDGVRIERAGAGWRAVSEVPLAVVRVNGAAAAMLELTRAGGTVADLATALEVDHERILLLCEHFRRRGMLEVVVDPGRDAAPKTAPTSPHESAPAVTVIVPTKDRAADLDDCLAALAAVDYPRERLEVIVVDDGSTDETPDVAHRHSCRYLANDRNRGQSYSRNVGAREASGEILAFIDSDCVASHAWLRELVPFFSWSKVAAVGGFVAGYYDDSPLDRYEQVASSLNMGDRVILMTGDRSMAYVPTCNLLVRKDAYLSQGGLREEMRVGEDVDLCWRLREAGWYLVYSPTGTVKHRHRNRLSGMLARRAAYGTSEALLRGLHPDRRKTMPVRLLPALTVGILVTAAVSLQPRFLALSLVPLAADGVRSTVRLAREGVRIRPGRVWFAALRGHLSFVYSVSFHLVRYYLVALAAAGFAVPGLWVIGGAAAVYVAAVDYGTKRPRLSFPVYLGLSLAEHAAYQVGVFAGCLRRRSFRSYGVRFLWTDAFRRGGRAPVAAPSISLGRAHSGS